MSERMNQAPQDMRRVPTMEEVRAGVPRSWFAQQMHASGDPMVTGTYADEIKKRYDRGDVDEYGAVDALNSYDGTMGSSMAINAVAGWVERRGNHLRARAMMSAAVLANSVESIPVDPQAGAVESVADAFDRVAGDLQHGAEAVMHPVVIEERQLAGIAAG